MNFHEGLRYQRGSGIGSFLSGMFRSLKPLARMGLSLGKRFMGSDMAKTLGNTALDIGKQSATNVITDLLEGVPLRETAQNQLEQAKSKISTAIKGGGRKRKKKQKKTITCKKIAYSLI